MSTKMDGITQPSLFSGTLRLDIIISEEDRYRILSEELPWLQLADVSNHYRSKVVDINDGRALNLRLHLGASRGKHAIEGCKAKSSQPLGYEPPLSYHSVFCPRIVAW